MLVPATCYVMFFFSIRFGLGIGIKFETVLAMAKENIESFPTRQWSCSTLMRGASFLSEQVASKKTATYAEIIGVSKLQ